MVLVPLGCSVVNALICSISSGRSEITPGIVFLALLFSGMFGEKYCPPLWTIYVSKTKKITSVSSQMIEESPLRDVLRVSVAETVTCWPRGSSPGSREQPQKPMD